MQSDNCNSSQGGQSHWVIVDKTAECKRCGRKSLAWQQSKSGRWYLCVTRRTKDGEIEADRRGFHKCQDPITNVHGVRVSDHDLPF
jgi:hypothetical protein